MENYEKKYKEALGWMREKYPEMSSIDKTCAEYYFPELKESDDVWIRKEIINYFKEKGDYRSCWMTWIERQKPVEWGDEDEEVFNDILLDLADRREMFNQKGEDTFASNTQKEIDWLHRITYRLKHQPKQEWSEEDEVIRQDAIYFINEFQKSNRCKDENDLQNSVTCENWLKSIKPQPQKVGIIDGIIWHPTEEQLARLEVMCGMFKADNVLESLLNDLKQLKLVNLYDRESNDKPQPYWKPTEKQIEVLERYLYALSANENKEVLFSLYEDIKKL